MKKSWRINFFMRKRCKICELEKDKIEFYKNRRSCKKCHNKSRLEYNRLYRNNRYNKDLTYKTNRLQYEQTLLKTNNEYRIRKIQYNIKYERQRRLSDPKYRLDRNISKGIWESLKKNKNNKHWERLVGYTLEDLILRLQETFQKGMTWDNYGKWHVDHIKPKCLFKYKTCNEQFKKCWELNNLQALWAKDNLCKGSTFHA